MKRPVLSPQFTIEDIHKLREYNDYLTKDMTTQEQMMFYNNTAMKVQREIEALRTRNRIKPERYGEDAHA